ncbi:membrane-associated phospholipid phosphatase [Stackebrandtia albiflava]|uniref:Membrane-associated phospholipid phosphatase n=1 Tax=Stackebrandtia albiflava TaxID=406432 RepID=A0A562V1T7_9ACTN|nr:phosphatase PAP2 family protein [Stackebrandtia albiflava]TWJ11793.1 membrane-associated phospholipid phosphatase [Stackebrandtia albiflava]
MAQPPGSDGGNPSAPAATSRPAEAPASPAWPDRLLDRFWPVTGERWRPYGGPRSWWPDVLMLLTVAALSALLVWPSPLVELDILVRDWSLSHQPEWARFTADMLRYVGQGTPLAVIALGLAAITAWRYRTIRPLLLHVAVWFTSSLVIKIGKDLTDRVAPRYPGAELPPPYVDANGSVLFTPLEPSASYPSGHAANTAVWFAFIVLLLGAQLTHRQRMILYVAPPVILLLSQTYLGYHWLTDTPAGYLLGMVVIRCLQRLPWATLPLGPLNRFDPGPAR